MIAVALRFQIKNLVTLGRRHSLRPAGGQMNSVSLFDIDGRKLKVLQPFSETLNMDTQSLKNGLYILKIEWSNGSTANEKLMIAH